MTSLALPARAARAARPAPRARARAPEAAPVHLFLAAGCALILALLAAAPLRLAADEFAMVATGLALLVWLAWCLRGRGAARIATALEAMALFSAVCLIVTLISFLLATHQRPLVDAQLAAADRLLLPGFDWPGTMRAFARSGWPVQVANTAYESIRWQPALLVVLLATAGRHAAVWRFLLAWTATLALVVAVFALTPALGAYAHFGIAAAAVPAMHDPTPWHQAELIAALRAGTLQVVNTGTLDGIVTFPSFHAAAGLLLARAFWRVRALRWGFAALNALMIASAMPIGGHYVIDIAAGLAVAAAGSRIADTLPTWWARLLPAAARSGRSGG